MVSDLLKQLLNGTRFPLKLYLLASSEEIPSIQWSNDNRSVLIDSRTVKHECYNVLMFNVKDHASFKRQLYCYGFQKINGRSVTWKYRHPFFKTGRLDLLCNVKRRPTRRSARPIQRRVVTPSHSSHHEPSPPPVVNLPSHSSHHEPSPPPVVNLPSHSSHREPSPPPVVNLPPPPVVNLPPPPVVNLPLPSVFNIIPPTVINLLPPPVINLLPVSVMSLLPPPVIMALPPVIINILPPVINLLSPPVVIILPPSVFNIIPPPVIILLPPNYNRLFLSRYVIL
ncbi:HSF_DOMAIN domain-containing protein [Caerostris darwini]|uniref:HSF_DOMAIN domain-containing protein n=1 Tax=Caerostris darwini TaxID=1538125 RepID=A0AAV4UPQ1_9ARAC|nr:HSF_DOMAIN domain-containing protein [Caerostris darwini]